VTQLAERGSILSGFISSHTYDDTILGRVSTKMIIFHIFFDLNIPNTIEPSCRLLNSSGITAVTPRAGRKVAGNGVCGI
jgi:hypothetical protein